MREADMLDGLGLSGLQDFRGVKDKAFNTADARFRRDDWNDNHNDAFRHTYWNALMTKKYGAEWAAEYVTAHEARPGNRPEREAMDLYNNEAGRRIAQQHPDASERGRTGRPGGEGCAGRRPGGDRPRRRPSDVHRPDRLR
ncbi:hypothetical protein IHE61_21660 [Streptomyces sp. GKU 257-1]|nr:hypothetical protein [Streptomyces sp. GKU 257-1]